MQAHSSDRIRRPGHAQSNMTARSASFDRRTRSEESWVEISSQPSSSSLSSIADEIITTGLRVQHDPRIKRRRALRHTPSGLHVLSRPSSAGGTSSQEEYEESESESDRVLTSSGEGAQTPAHIFNGADMSPATRSAASQESSIPQASDDDDENRTAINYPTTRNDQCFTPQPNAFSHPPSGQMRSTTQPESGSYFPSQRPAPRSSTRNSLPTQQEANRSSHMPQNILSPSYNAAAQHDEALRASLSTLLSCAAAARGLPKSEQKQPEVSIPRQRSNRVEPMSLRLVPESALPATSSPTYQFQEPTFKPTFRREASTTTSASSASHQLTTKENKRKAVSGSGGGGRATSRERRALKKARRTSPSEDLHVSPTLLTWVVSAGVVVFLSALSFSAGYGMGREAGRLEAAGFVADEQVRSCAREAGRSGLGLRRSLARSAVQV